MAKAKKVYLRDLQRYNREREESVVRQLEMTADMAITSPGYSIQLWRDVQLYGVDEAILYMRNGNHGDADAVSREWAAIKEQYQL